MMKVVLLLALLLVVGLPAAAYGQKSTSSQKEVTLTGYVVDAMCGKMYARKSNAFDRARKHTRACALEETCAASGYGIVTEQGWKKFDAAGDGKAKKAIEKSKRKNGLLFEVKGTLKGDTLVVASLTEIAGGGEHDGQAKGEHHTH